MFRQIRQSKFKRVSKKAVSLTQSKFKSMSQEAVSLKALVDSTNNRVIFAESDEDFIDVLFSFLTMPMGTITRLIRNHSPTVRIGSMKNLYESIENIVVQRFQTEACKTMLLYPRNGAAAECRNLKLEIVNDESRGYYFCDSQKCPLPEWSLYQNAICSCGERMGRDILGGPANNYTPGRGVFVKGMKLLMVTNELHIMPASTKVAFSLLSNEGITDASTIEECNLNVGVYEVLNLLKCSLTSKMPLTATFLNPNVDPEESHKEDLDQVSYVKSRMEEPASNENGKVHIKLFISKSKSIVCYAEASEDFVDLLFSFVTVPLGYIVKEMHSSISKGCINHLYNSIHELDIEQFLKSDNHKTMLVSPKLAPEFSYKNKAFGIDSFRHSNESLPTVVDPTSSAKEDTRGGFMSGPALFTVTDNLIVKPFSPISGLSLLKNLKVAFDDIKECIVNVGKEEALRLLVASFVSESVLTSTFLKEPNPES